MTTKKMSGRTGLILAAGFGSRLKGSVDETSLKPLTPVGNVPLIFRTIESLKLAGCTRIIIVLGFGNKKVQATIKKAYAKDLPIEFVFNKKYDLKNGVSVLAAKPLVHGNFILTMADHVLGKKLMEKAGAHTPAQNGATLLVDYKIDAVFDFDDATKVKEKHNQILNIGKQIEEFNCIDTGVFVCSQGLMDVLDKLYSKQGDVSLSEGINYLAKQGLMQTLDIEGGFWQDVDTPEMLKHAEKMLSID
jgi:choline kinase